jgi:hypothetical protein
MIATIPPLRDLAQAFLDRPYGADQCWTLVLDLLHAGGFREVDADPVEAVKTFTEIWFHDDPRDPLTLGQPWDLWLLRQKGYGPAVTHVGLIVDTQSLIHTRNGAGVVLEPLRRWRPRLIQLARMRCLM